MRFGRTVALFVLALAGCDKPAPKPEIESPEAIYAKMKAAVLAADADAQWVLFSARYRSEAQQKLEELKSLPADQLAAAAKSVGTTPEAVRSMKPEEALGLALKLAQKDAAKMAKYKDLGTPQGHRDGNRLRLLASTSDRKWSYEVILVEEAGQWKVDSEEETDTETQDIGR
ncbi:MAG: hypothetical protein K8T20_16465 [Planctomycetes bacterium]|nr:hypothetical protein [Planctomycetota bacterium]